MNIPLFPWWKKYPNVNDEILNLDWVIYTVKHLTEEVSNFINLNTIKYADPILWDITSQYEANTIVVDPQTGDAYISTQAVPYGVSLDNTSYWTKIYNYADAVNTFEEQIAAANEELSTTASAARSAGDLVWLNGYLYQVIAPMIAGDSYVEGSNCIHVTIEQLIGNLKSLDTSIKSSLVDAINEVNAHADTNTNHIGNLADLDTDIKTSLVEAINEVDNHADVNNTNIGNLADLDTSDKTNIVAAINEVNSNSLTTLKNKKILIIGDSISATDNGIAGCQPVWSTQFADKLANICDKITNISYSGAKMIDMPTYLSSVNDWDFDIVLVFLGTNDAFTSPAVPMGNFGSDYTKFTDSLRQCYEIIHNNIYAATGKKEELYFITPIYRTAGVNSIGYPLWFYNAAITGFCKRWGIKWINGYQFPMSGELYSDWTLVDGLHPSTEYASVMCDYIINKITSGGDDSSYNNDSMVVSLEGYLASGVTGTFKGFIENERLHLHGRLSYTPAANNEPITSDISAFLSTTLFSQPYVAAITFGATNGAVTGLVFKSGNGLNLNANYNSFEATTVEFDYIEQPEWCNIARSN